MITAANVAMMLRTVAESSWTDRILDGTSRETKWLPVVEFGTQNPRHRFGLMPNGLWCAEFASRQHIASADNRVLFLPLLEEPWPEVASRVAGSLAQLGMSPKAAWTFPLDDIVLLGLSSTERWHRLALSWVDRRYPMNDSIAAQLPKHPLVVERYNQRMQVLFDCRDLAG